MCVYPVPTAPPVLFHLLGLCQAAVRVGTGAKTSTSCREDNEGTYKERQKVTRAEEPLDIS